MGKPDHRPVKQPQPVTLYEKILEFYRPSELTEHSLHNADVSGEETNPVCGDSVAIKLKLIGGRIDLISIVTEGCVVVQVSAYLLKQALHKRSLDEVDFMGARFRAFIEGQNFKEDELIMIQPLMPLKVLRDFPIRRKCALLVWMALQNGIEAYGLSNYGVS